jgi:putative transposase
VHLQRNVLAKAPQRLRSRLAKAVTHVFDAPSKAEAKKRVEALAVGLGKQVPEAIACLDSGFEAATHFYAFPREHWHRIRSTNGLERRNRPSNHVLTGSRRRAGKPLQAPAGCSRR